MRDFPTKIDNVSTLSAEEFNEYIEELENVVTSSGGTLASGTTDLLKKAVSQYVANASFYTDTGAADAYVAAVISPFQGPPALLDGLEVELLIGNTNTGASMTEHSRTRDTLTEDLPL